MQENIECGAAGVKPDCLSRWGFGQNWIATMTSVAARPGVNNDSSQMPEEVRPRPSPTAPCILSVAVGNKTAATVVPRTAISCVHTCSLVL